MGLETPVIFILGATGTGKTELGIQLAKRFGGEIVNADAMQIYRGLDVVTNKAPASVLAEVRHHLVNIVDPLKEDFNVTHFRDLALPIIDSLRHRGTLPIVVGGTNYYAEALLWQCLLGNKEPGIAAELHSRCVSREATNAYFLTPTVALARSIAAAVADGGGHGTVTSAGDSLADAVAMAACLDFEHLRKNIGVVDGPKLHALLMRIDPCYARTIHPNTTRKTIRALEAFVQNGRTVSELHSEQKLRPEASGLCDRGGCDSGVASKAECDDASAETSNISSSRELTTCRQLSSANSSAAAADAEAGASKKAVTSTSLFGGRLRYERSLVLWLRCAQPVLDARLDARVDEMLKRDLTVELLDFHRKYNASRIAGGGGSNSSDTTISEISANPSDVPDYCKGIFQSIGFKEFHDYLTLTDGQRLSEMGQSLFERGVTAMKTATRRYARYQVKWVSKRFLEQRERSDVPPVHALDCTNLEFWQSAVVDKACEIVGAALRGELLAGDEERPLSGSSSCHLQAIVVDDLNPVVHRQCDVCRDGRVFVRQTEWAAHCKSRQHAKMMSRRRRDQRPLPSGCGGKESCSSMASDCVNVAVPSTSRPTRVKLADAVACEDQQDASDDGAAGPRECLQDLSSLPPPQLPSS